jgi:hypothetical protein
MHRQLIGLQLRFDAFGSFSLHKTYVCQNDDNDDVVVVAAVVVDDGIGSDKLHLEILRLHHTFPSSCQFCNFFSFSNSLKVFFKVFTTKILIV